MAAVTMLILKIHSENLLATVDTSIFYIQSMGSWEVHLKALHIPPDNTAQLLISSSVCCSSSKTLWCNYLLTIERSLYG